MKIRLTAGKKKSSQVAERGERSQNKKYFPRRGKTVLNPLARRSYYIPFITEMRLHQKECMQAIKISM